MMTTEKPFRVLSLDGGGMRGTYTATYLNRLAADFAKRRGVPALDIGAAFDLIVGTSTGGIIGCALAVGISLSEVVTLYKNYGSQIFRKRVPNGLGLQLILQRWTRPRALARGTESLRHALTERFGTTTVAQVYAKRNIALAITAIEMSQHRSWVFKTPHLARLNGRDNDYSLVDVCLATSAAPVFRSMAVIDRPDGHGSNIFVDGGLWANNPVLVGLAEALEMAAPGQKIEIFSIGTCPMPAGEQVAKHKIHRGLSDWKFGSAAASLSIDAQEFAFDYLAKNIASHVDHKCELVRFPRDQIPASLMSYLDLDDVREEAMEALINQARTDADTTNGRLFHPNSREGNLIQSLFNDAPEMTVPSQAKCEVPEKQSTDSEL